MGGQLGSTLLLWHCIAAPQEYLTRTFIVPIGTTRVWRFGGHRNFGVPPHLRRGRYVPFSGIKKSSSAKNFQTKSWRFTSRKSQKRKTNCGCELRNSNLSRKSLTTKNAKTQNWLRLQLRNSKATRSAEPQRYAWLIESLGATYAEALMLCE